MSQQHNDNVVSKFETNNVNDNEVKGMRRILNANRIAKDLVRKFGGQNLSDPTEHGSWKFYCDVANRLPEAKIRLNMEIALTKAKSNPGGYFNRLCQVSLYEMRMNRPS